MKTPRCLLPLLLCAATALGDDTADEIKRELFLKEMREIPARLERQEQLDRIERGLAARQAPPAAPAITPSEARFNEAVEESKRLARVLYPDLRVKNSRLSQQWHVIYNDLVAKRDPLLDFADAPLLIAVRAANTLAIYPCGLPLELQ